jgi:hypothetical protein
VIRSQRDEPHLGDRRAEITKTTPKHTKTTPTQHMNTPEAHRNTPEPHAIHTDSLSGTTIEHGREGHGAQTGGRTEGGLPT